MNKFAKVSVVTILAAGILALGGLSGCEKTAEPAKTTPPPAKAPEKK